MFELGFIRGLDALLAVCLEPRSECGEGTPVEGGVETAEEPWEAIQRVALLEVTGLRSGLRLG